MRIHSNLSGIMLPYFYIPVYDKGQTEIVLDEDSSRHIVQVLRMKPGEPLQLTDGKGNLLAVRLVDDHKKKAVVKLEQALSTAPPQKKVSIAISLLKNANRFEWFLEKSMELGVTEILPLLCDRTEKQHFRQDRMQAILVSAMLQSQQGWLPGLGLPTPIRQVVEGSRQDRRFIAHCIEDKKVSLREAIQAGIDPMHASATGDATRPVPGSSLILIGPEGDFSAKEIEFALEQGFIPVTLGETRLRSETAGVAAAVLLCMG